MDGMNTAEQQRIARSFGSGNQAKAHTNVLNAGLDVRRFRLLAQTKPRTKAGQVRQVWPEIKVALASGHRLKDIRTWLNEIGIEIGYARLSDYVGQLKRGKRFRRRDAQFWKHGSRWCRNRERVLVIEAHGAALGRTL